MATWFWFSIVPWIKCFCRTADFSYRAKRFFFHFFFKVSDLWAFPPPFFCNPRDWPSMWSTWFDSLKFGEMSFGTGRVRGCYVNIIHTCLIRYIHNVSFVAPLCIFGTDTWALQTLTVLFRNLTHICSHSSEMWASFSTARMVFSFPCIPLCLLSAVLVSSELFYFILLQGYLVSLVFSR